jgi:hypothetical protein
MRILVLASSDWSVGWELALIWVLGRFSVVFRSIGVIFYYLPEIPCYWRIFEMKTNGNWLFVTGSISLDNAVREPKKYTPPSGRLRDLHTTPQLVLYYNTSLVLFSMKYTLASWLAAQVAHAPTPTFADSCARCATRHAETFQKLAQERVGLYLVDD